MQASSRLFAVALVLSLFVGAAAHAAQAVVLAVSRSPLSLPIYLAQERGYFEAEGLDAKVVDCIGGHRCLRSMLDGQADVATATEMPVVFNSFDRSDFAIFGTFVSSSDDVKLVTRVKAGIGSARELGGKRVGMVSGTASQYVLDLLLLTAGVDPRSLAITPLQPEEMVEALRSGRVDAIAAWEPYAWLAVQALGRDAAVLAGGGGYIETFNLVAPRRMADARTADLAAVLRAVERANRAIRQEPREAQALLRRRLQLDQAFVDWVWPSLRFRLGLDQALVATMEGEARWAQREGHVKSRNGGINYLSLVHTAPLKSVEPGAVTIEP